MAEKLKTTEIEEALNPERQLRAKEYAQISRRLFALDLVLGAVYVLLWILAGWSPWLRDQVHQLTTATWLSVPLFAAGFGLPYFILTAPLTYYSGFVLPHRYGQSNQTLKAWLWDQLKGLLITGILGLIILEVIYALLGAFPQTWWLWTALVMLVFTVLLSNLAPVLIFPLFYKYKPLDDEDLVSRLTHLATKAGARVQGVYVFDMSSKTVAANAALMGLGNTRRIVLADTLVERFTANEIETVLAHELGHHVHKDLPLGIIVQSLLTLIGFWLADLVMRWGVTTFAYISLTDPATLPLLMVALSIFGLVTMPLSNSWSRWREVKADEYALKMTGKPRAFISAMTRLANQNLAEAEPPVWVEFLLHSHPSINKRVAKAKSFSLSRSNF
ncbi:MAG: M48 family peptidase [Anaerolineae bacterium]|nr:M48 family metallopeptidase [Anaerolineales bacterium]MCQ3973736.1 M48 family peptidase [Anaerolineae bacterium]